MKEQLNKNALGISLGVIFALLHIIWMVIAASGFAEIMASWLIGAHFIDIDFSISQFNFVMAVFTIIRASIAGYVIGWLFALIFNKTKGGIK